jgi:uncharacterized protein involved in response to NO
MTDTYPIKRKPVPRGIAHTGPVILAYGFRPFFLAAGIWAILAVGLWIAALVTGLPIGGVYGGSAWHAHEMLFGYTSAALAGFLLTAIPNWTGRLPVSGRPLAMLVALWMAGRVAMIYPDALGLHWAVVIDAAFLPLLLAICLREVVAGKKWRDLKVLAAVLALALANIGYHALTLMNGDHGMANRLAVSAYVMLIAIIGGRVVPSFTRNWLAKRHVLSLPAPYQRFDTVALLAGLVALAAWLVAPYHWMTSVPCLIAGLLHAVRLGRWKSWQTAEERLVLVLHLAYGCLPLGFLAIAAVPFGFIDPAAALHVFTVGAIGLMTLAIMSRATRGHTGLALSASTTTAISYGLLLAGAVLRPLAGFLPSQYTLLISISGLSWIAAFVLFLTEYAPVLLLRRKPRPE